MKKILFFFIAILLVGCSKDNNGIDEDEIPSPKDQYYVKYVAKYCSYHDHYINYRDTEGNLVSQIVPKETGSASIEIGPVSPSFQAYMEGDYCVYVGPEISIYIRKNNQNYIQMATTSVRSGSYNPGKKSLTFNMREYD